MMDINSSPTELIIKKRKFFNQFRLVQILLYKESIRKNKMQTNKIRNICLFFFIFYSKGTLMVTNKRNFMLNVIIIKLQCFYCELYLLMKQYFHTYCQAITVHQIVFGLFRFSDYDNEPVVGVTSQQRVLTPTWHLIILLTSVEVRVSFVSCFPFRFLILNTVCFHRTFQRMNDKIGISSNNQISIIQIKTLSEFFDYIYLEYVYNDFRSNLHDNKLSVITSSMCKST